MSCHLEKDSASAQFVSGLQPCSHPYPEKEDSGVSVKEKDEAEASDPADFTEFFFNLFQDLSQKMCRKFLRVSFYIGLTTIDYDL